MTNELKTAGQLINENRGEAQQQLLTEALKQWTWDEIAEAVQLAKLH